jgi:hypothetical protein
MTEKVNHDVQKDEPQKGGYHKMFQHLAIPKTQWAEKEDNKYQVYSNKNDFVTVCAENASEAVAKSEITKPYKITRVLYELFSIIDQKMIKSDGEDSTRDNG